MRDNFDLIKGLVDFSSKEHFYFVQILQRKKDHKDGLMKVNGSNNNARLIKAYYINSEEYWEFIQPEIKELCKVFNARAGINLNRRHYQKSAFQHLKKVTDQILNGNFDKAHKAYSSAVGMYGHEPHKTWILDIDRHDPIYISNLPNVLYNIEPIGEKIVAKIPSKSGYHYIVRPFNVQTFRSYSDYNDIDIQKNNPTNLYIP